MKSAGSLNETLVELKQAGVCDQKAEVVFAYVVSIGTAYVE